MLGVGVILLVGVMLILGAGGVDKLGLGLGLLVGVGVGEQLGTLAQTDPIVIVILVAQAFLAHLSVLKP
jgi:hypothetical protein